MIDILFMSIGWFTLFADLWFFFPDVWEGVTGLSLRVLFFTPLIAYILHDHVKAPTKAAKIQNDIESAKERNMKTHELLNIQRVLQADFENDEKEMMFERLRLSTDVLIDKLENMIGEAFENDEMFAQAC